MVSTKSPDKDILDYVAPDGSLIPGRCVKKVLVNRGYYEYLLSRYPDNTVDRCDEKMYIRETLYRMMNGIETVPVCRVCGKSVAFSHTSYPNYCSRYCSNHDEDVVKRISKSCSESLKKTYSERGDDIREKRRNTLSEKYDVNLESSSPFAVCEINEKSRTTVRERYGVDSVLSLEFVREKSLESQRLKSIRRQTSRGLDITRQENGDYLVRNCCPIHGDMIFSPTDFNNRFRPSRYRFSNPCPVCNPYGNGMSGMQESLLDYIKSVYDGRIIENDRTVLAGKEIDIYLPDINVGFEFNGDYWHMNPLRYPVDCVNPSTGIAAGDKWRDDRHKILTAASGGVTLYPVWEYYYTNYRDAQLDFILNIIKGNIEYEHPLVKLKRELDMIDEGYELNDDMFFDYGGVRIIYLDGFHFNRGTISEDFLLSLKRDGVRNIFVYDYEVTDERKFQVILSDIRYALGKIDDGIYARNCELREITNSESRVFLEENSLFGYRSASKVLGLYYRDELVMVYSFGNNYYGRKKDTEVIRVCTRKNTRVIGGSSRCLKYYMDKFSYDGETVVFYVDSIHHDGTSMKLGGFEYTGHRFGLMNYYVTFDRFGEAFGRNPGRHAEIEDMKRRGEVIEVITNGVDVYRKIVKK